jgi:hypothetical protein
MGDARRRPEGFYARLGFVVAEEVARHPTAHYTKTLLAATPTLRRDVQRA